MQIGYCLLPYSHGYLRNSFYVNVEPGDPSILVLNKDNWKTFQQLATEICRRNLSETLHVRWELAIYNGDIPETTVFKPFGSIYEIKMDYFTWFKINGGEDGFQEACHIKSKICFETSGFSGVPVKAPFILSSEYFGKHPFDWEHRPLTFESASIHFPITQFLEGVLNMFVEQQKEKIYI